MLIKIAALATFRPVGHQHPRPLARPEDRCRSTRRHVKMKDVSGKEISLKDAAGTNGLLVIFSCNTCPFVVGSEGSEGWEGRYRELAAYAKRMGVGVAFVNSNEAKRNDGDSFADMQKRYKERTGRLLPAGQGPCGGRCLRSTHHTRTCSSSTRV
jgi:sugar phosphate isomerase/epimerase